MNARIPLPRLSWLAPLVVLGVAAGLQFQVALNHDVAWLLLAAQRMLRGGSYTADFFETNLPLAIAAYIPVEWLGALTGMPAPAATRCWTLLLAVQSAGLCVALLRPAQRSLLAAWLLAGLILLPAYDFAQKEHFIALLLLPFLGLLAAPRPVAAPLRAYVSLLAALGAYLKPHYAPLPFVLLAIHGGRGGLRPALQSLEFGVLAGCGLAYGVLVLLLYPEWFEVASWAQDLYGAYRRVDGFEVVTWELAASVALLGFLAVLARAGKLSGQSLAPFLVAGAYGLLAYVLQLKGWRYQWLPGGIFTFAAMGIALCAGSGLWVAAGRGTRLALLALGACGAVHALAAALAAPRTAALMKSEFVQALSGLPRGAPIAVLSTANVPFFPTVTVLELTWSSRYHALWPLAGLAAAPQQLSGAAADALLERYREPFVASVVEDFQRYRPVAVVVDERPGQFGLPEGFRILDFLQADPRFAAVWSGYAPGMAGEGLVVYFARQ